MALMLEPEKNKTMRMVTFLSWTVCSAEIILGRSKMVFRWKGVPFHNPDENAVFRVGDNRN